VSIALLEPRQIPARMDAPLRCGHFIRPPEQALRSAKWKTDDQSRQHAAFYRRMIASTNWSLASGVHGGGL
jgi:hypothetical protein